MPRSKSDELFQAFPISVQPKRAVESSNCAADFFPRRVAFFNGDFKNGAVFFLQVSRNRRSSSLIMLSC